MLDTLRRRRLVRVRWHEEASQFGESQIEILPTLAHVAQAGRALSAAVLRGNGVHSMGRRISLTRIIAINWYGFRQIFDVDKACLFRVRSALASRRYSNEVRAALRAYDDTRRRLEKQEDEAGFLRRICEQHERCEHARREEAMLQHTAHALRLLQAKERRARCATELKRLEDEHAEDLKNLEAARLEAAAVEKLLGEVRFEIQKDPEGGKLDQLDRQKREMEGSVKALREAQKSARQRLDERHYRWVQWLKNGPPCHGDSGGRESEHPRWNFQTRAAPAPTQAGWLGRT
jgi:hypothetical protein